jgi:hypothetical protein
MMGRVEEPVQLDLWVTEAMGILLFFWEGEWEVGVSIVHSLHEPHVTCQPIF